jgi:hypothetical protein
MTAAITELKKEMEEERKRAEKALRDINEQLSSSKQHYDALIVEKDGQLLQLRRQVDLIRKGEGKFTPSFDEIHDPPVGRSTPSPGRTLCRHATLAFLIHFSPPLSPLSLFVLVYGGDGQYILLTQLKAQREEELGQARFKVMGVMTCCC